MSDEDEEMIDIEDIIPRYNIILKENEEDLRITRTRTKNTQGFFETARENTINIAKEISNNHVSSNSNNNNVYKVICLSIEDIKKCTYDSEKEYWKFNNKILFRNVLIFGRVVILNESTKNNRSFYTLNIDDETDSITGFLNKMNPQNTSGCNVSNLKNTLERRKVTGINIRGIYHHKDSEECKQITSDIESLQHMMTKSSERNFSLGVVKEQSLIYASPFLQTINNHNNNNTQDTIQLRIIDLKLCDHYELSWKRNLNRLYVESYLK